MIVEDLLTKRENMTQKTGEQVMKLFHTMSEGHGYKNTYNMLNTKIFKESFIRIILVLVLYYI